MNQERLRSAQQHLHKRKVYVYRKGNDYVLRLNGDMHAKVLKSKDDSHMETDTKKDDVISLGHFLVDIPV